MSYAPLARISLRYISAALTTYGLITPETGAMIAVDPDIIAMAGVAIGFAVEAFYAVAVKKGWAK